ncbi:MAG: hypothetical protein AAGJ08_07265 [Cyanobacteria bacterium P01_H01_bin.35]
MASSFALLAPSASAFVPLDSDGDGYYEGVEKLDVAGTLYDVELVVGSFEEVYNDGGGVWGGVSMILRSILWRR